MEKKEKWKKNRKKDGKETKKDRKTERKEKERKYKRKNEKMKERKKWSLSPARHFKNEPSNYSSITSEGTGLLITTNEYNLNISTFFFVVLLKDKYEQKWVVIRWLNLCNKNHTAGKYVMQSETLREVALLPNVCTKTSMITLFYIQ